MSDGVRNACTGFAFWSAIGLILGYPLALLFVQFGIIPPIGFFVFSRSMPGCCFWDTDIPTTVA